jgi:hypothetical protein
MLAHEIQPQEKQSFNAPYFKPDKLSSSGTMLVSNLRNLLR